MALSQQYKGWTLRHVGLALFSIALFCGAVILGPVGELVALLLLVAAVVTAWAFVRRAPSGFGLADGVMLGIGWLVFGTLANAVNPFPHVRHAAAKRTQCLSNVKQQAIAMSMYASEYDDHFPLADSWHTANEPFVKDELRCPSATSPWTYAMNSPLSGKAFDAIDQPADLVLLFEADASLPNASGGREWLVFRHPLGESKVATIGFADGHAKLRNATQAAALQW